MSEDKHKGSARKMHAQALAAVPILDGIDPKSAIPLMWAGTMIWAPIQNIARPTDHVGWWGSAG